MSVELAARSHYSFLEGASSPRDLVAAAVTAGVDTLGLCDRNGLYGAVAFVQAAHAAGVRPLVGAELDLVDGSSLRLLARGPAGYRQLARAISAAQLAGEKGRPLLDLFGDPPLPGRSGGRVEDPPRRPAALRPTAGPFPEGWPGLPSARRPPAGPAARVDPAELDDCLVLAGGSDSPVTAALVAGDRRGAGRLAGRLREAFGRDRVALLLNHHLHPADSWLVEETTALARRSGLMTAVSNLPVHATPGDKPLLDVLTAIRHRTTLDDAAAHGLLLPNAEHHLKSETQLRALLGAHPEAFDTAALLASQCRVSLDFSDVRFPGFPVPEGETPFSVLYRLCQEAVQQRYRPVTRAVAARLQRELDVIERTGLAEFFLITWDIMRFARENGIPGQGRGSAADSIVAYLLGITRVDPVAHDLLFERFLHEDHQGTPDIDIDFSTDHREQVIQYVYERYGAERTGMVANVVTFRPRMAVRQVGAAMGFPETVVDRLAKSVDRWFFQAPGPRAPDGRQVQEGSLENALQVAGLEGMLAGAGEVPPWPLFLDVLRRVEGTPRHLGIHVGGMLVTGAPLVDVAPVERATMPGRVVVQFNKDDVEDLGLIKMDLLGLRTLSLIAECLDLVEQTTGGRPDLDALPLDDPRVYRSIQAVDTIGLFQIESRAQQQSLYQSQPEVFNDLIVQVAIIRPGPIQGNAVHPYLRRRRGLEPVTYLHPSLEPILAETQGVVLYQEQILRIVMEVAGYSAGEADRFRRAMNRHRSPVEMSSLRDGFIERCGARGLPLDVAEQVFASVAGFAVYGFCKSHAAAFARTAYETAWLRLEHPAAYHCALLNAQPMGFYHPSVLVEDAKRHGVTTLPVDVVRSRARCRLEWVGEGPPPPSAVAAVLTPGWRLEDGRVVSDPAARRPRTRAEEAAVAAVQRARQAAAVHEREVARRTGREPRPPAAVSDWAVRLGYGYVRGLGPAGRVACDEASGAGATASTTEFWRASGLTRPAMEALVSVGAFDAATGRPRRELLWELRAAEDAVTGRRRRRVAAAAAAPAAATPTGPPRGRSALQGSRLGDTPTVAVPPAPPPLLVAPAASPPLPALGERERVAAEYRVSELSTGAHLTAFLRDGLRALGCTPIAEVGRAADGAPVRVGGLVVARQAPASAKGFRFFTLADEGGHIDLILRPPVVRRYRAVADFHPLLVVDGRLQSADGRLDLLVERVRAIDGDGRLIDDSRAALGHGAPPDAPPTQHGHVRPAAGTAEQVRWPAPASHDFR